MAANIFWGRTPLSMPPRGGSKNFQGDSPESFRDGIFAEGRRRADGGGSCGILQCSKNFRETNVIKIFVKPSLQKFS